MGLSVSEKGSKTYLSIINGKLAQKVPAGTPNAVSRENKNKQIINELLYDTLDGVITGLRMKDSDFGRELVVEIQSGIDKFTLNIPMESKYFDTFCYKINSVNLNNEVKIAPYSFDPNDGKGKKTGINFYQNGVKLLHYYSPEDPKGKPFPDGKELSDSKWKIYKLQERDWLADMIVELSKKMGGAQETPQQPLSIKDLRAKSNQAEPQQSSDLPF